MKDYDTEVGQHSSWWEGKNNGMSKSWTMLDGKNPKTISYNSTDNSPWSFVYECNESSLPQRAMDVIYLFSPHSMTNLRGSMVPTRDLIPRF